MNTEQLKALIKDKQVIDFETFDQDFAHGLRLVLRDMESGELGLLAVEPCQLALPEEVTLDYSYQVLNSPWGVPPEECLISNLKTNIAPAYENGEVPFLFD